MEKDSLKIVGLVLVIFLMLGMIVFFSIINYNVDSSKKIVFSNSGYMLHKDITVTVFWVGEKPSFANREISNEVSAWDENWVESFGGVDDPDNREGYYPASFVPKENPFYYALPFNDLDGGERKEEVYDFIPWAIEEGVRSIVKNRWIKIFHDDKVAYAQWEDVGPFGYDDHDYIFLGEKPENQLNDNAGLDVSPAVRDYLELEDIDVVAWQFVDFSDVGEGPWREIVTG